MFQDGRMDKQIVVYVDNGICGQKKKKGKKSCHLQRHGWTFRALCSVKQVRERKINAVLPNLYMESKTATNKNKTEFLHTENRLVVARGSKWVDGLKG